MTVVRLLAVAAATLALVLALGCEAKKRKPTGTTADPVEVCEDFGQVCRIDSARLGVCNRSPDGGYTCDPQH